MLWCFVQALTALMLSRWWWWWGWQWCCRWRWCVAQGWGAYWAPPQSELRQMEAVCWQPCEVVPLLLGWLRCEILQARRQGLRWCLWPGYLPARPQVGQSCSTCQSPAGHAEDGESQQQCTFRCELLRRSPPSALTAHCVY